MDEYAGRWVALIRETDLVAGFGETGPAAFRAARRNRPKAKLKIRYVPDQSGDVLPLSATLGQLRKALARIDQPVYLVGGAVRDAILGRVSNDLDFVVPADGIKTAFKIGDFLRVPAFVLDEERDVGRVVLRKQGIYLDIATFRAGTLEQDLFDRDFTMNAIALPALATTTAELIDPLNGGEDLKNGRLRLAGDQAFINDPVRILRGVRMALKYDIKPEPETADAMKNAVNLLDQVSIERVRDELLNILNTDGAGGIQMLFEYQLLEVVLPKIQDLSGIQQSEPHFEPVFEHTISVLRWLKKLLNQTIEIDRLAPVIEQLRPHLERSVTGNLQGLDLLWLGALYHDVGKAETQTAEINDDGSTRYRFFGHDKVGSKITYDRLRHFHLSSEAVTHSADIVAGHMRPLLLANGPKVTVRAKHRFWKKMGTAGLDICLLSIADNLATYNGTGDAETWNSFLQSVSDLLDHWFAVEDPAVKRDPLVTGRDLMDGLEMKGGPEIGRLLDLIEEAHVAGEVNSPAEAIELARRSVQNRSDEA